MAIMIDPSELTSWLKPSPGKQDQVDLSVREIMEEVRSNGISAILSYTLKFDRVELAGQEFRVSDKELRACHGKVDPGTLELIRRMISRVKKASESQLQGARDLVYEDSENGIRSVLRSVPIRRIGLYAPAGKFPLFSSVIMAAVPAIAADCREIVLCSPPGKDGSINPLIAVAANECGVREIYKIGGAQAIAAMAYGCELFKPVSMIAGPGNSYVAAAKQMVSRFVKIDMPAGPSEVAIVADGSADPDCLALDMLAQLEHGASSKAFCLTTSSGFAKQLKQSLLANGCDPDNRNIAIAVLPDLAKCIDLVDSLAPEHLELYCEGAEQLAERITSAGAVFVRGATAFGDYGFCGSNHVLPTDSSGKWASSLSVLSFMRQQYVDIAKDESRFAGECAELAGLEGLEFHRRSALARKSKGRGKNEQEMNREKGELYE